MLTLTSYKTPQQFLNATAPLLEQRELENNLTLGLCNNFADKNKEQPNCVFINTIEDGAVRACSIKTLYKAIVSGTVNDARYFQPLADYYLQNNIHLAGVVGESVYAHLFANAYGKPLGKERSMIVHRLETINPQPVSPGKMLVATEKETELITHWTLLMDEETGKFPPQSREAVWQMSSDRIKAGNIVIWLDNDSIVSMAAIVRNTKTTGIIGLVYTPPRLRGKGYATSIVEQLTQVVSQRGFKYSGLFTDKSNPISNSIYRKIGYAPITEFSDIEFG